MATRKAKKAQVRPSVRKIKKNPKLLSVTFDIDLDELERLYRRRYGAAENGDTKGGEERIFRLR